MFLPNILKMNEKNGKLYSIPESFYITTITAKTEFVGDKANWNIDDLIAAYDAMPDGMKLTENMFLETLFTVLFQVLLIMRQRNAALTRLI